MKTAVVKAPAPQASVRLAPPPTPIRKPSGTVTYTVSKGADVWPVRR